MSNPEDARGTVQDIYIQNGRLTLMEWINFQTGVITYYYADQLPFAAKLYTVLSVLGSILSTPIVLLCWLPTIRSIKKVGTIHSSLHVALHRFTVAIIVFRLWYVCFDIMNLMKSLKPCNRHLCFSYTHMSHSL